MRLRSVATRTTLAALAAMLVFAVPARADGLAVIQDCIQGSEGISGTYSQKDYREALEMLTGDSDEYSDCRDQIREAQYAAARGAGSGGSGGTDGSTGSAGGGTSVAPSEFGNALRSKGIDPGAAPGSAVADPGPIAIAGEQVRLGEPGMPSINAALSLPAPLLAAAIVAFLAALLPLGRMAAARLRLRQTGDSAGPSAKV